MTRQEYLFEENCYITELHNSPDDPGVSVARVRVLPGEMTEWHWLTGITERYLILEGIGLAEVGNEAAREVKANDTVVIPAGVKQRIRNSGLRDLIFLAVCTPRFTGGKYQTIRI